jgi:hypothetical protein
MPKGKCKHLSDDTEEIKFNCVINLCNLTGISCYSYENCEDYEEREE